jgi:NitT/TauT family transport system substrate-binding protein
VEALLSGAVDATFIGPNPAINAFRASDGDAIRIVSGAASGGAFLVVREGITSPADLADATLATPQLGNTQDVALRTWLADQGYDTTPEGGGDVAVLPQENAQTLATFVAGDIDGAWVPEPWASRLVLEGGGHVLVDEATRWPDGEYVTTHLVVNTDYLAEHPDVVEALLEGVVETTDFLATDPARARTAVNDAIASITDRPLDPAIIEAAWGNLTFTYDPIASSLARSAANAEAAGLLDDVDLHGIYDLRLLNTALGAAGRPPVSDHDLGATA